jgi:DNA invertase Pin-like site-specific DNA recombinase
VSVTHDVRRQVEERLKELQPLVDEYERLRQVADLLADTPDAGSRKGRGRSTPRRSLEGRGGSRRATGQRSEDALKLIREQPGITVAATAEALGIGTTYLYRLLPRLEREGVIRKEGRGYVPA